MWVFLVLTAVGIAALIYSARRHAELFVVRVQGGQSRFMRGRIPSQLLSDITDVVKRAKVESANIHVVAEGGEPRVVAPELSPGTLQQLRNVVGTYKVAQIRAGTRPRALGPSRSRTKARAKARAKNREKSREKSKARR